MMSGEEIDALDITLLTHLQKDAKVQYRRLVDLTGKSLGTISNRVQKLTEMGVIKAWTIQIDAEKVGFDLTVIINIQIDVKYLDEVNLHLSKIPELIAIYNVTGDYDITAIARVKTRRHLDAVIHQILKTDYIRRTSSNVVLRILKEDFRVNFQGQ